jgi:hypothetical protein
LSDWWRWVVFVVLLVLIEVVTIVIFIVIHIPRGRVETLRLLQHHL